MFDGSKDLCPKKEGLEVIVTTVTATGLNFAPRWFSPLTSPVVSSPPQSCPAAIDEVFNSKLHIIGGVGIGIGIIMVRDPRFPSPVTCRWSRWFTTVFLPVFFPLHRSLG